MPSSARDERSLIYHFRFTIDSDSQNEQPAVLYIVYVTKESSVVGLASRNSRAGRAQFEINWPDSPFCPGRAPTTTTATASLPCALRDREEQL